MSLGTWHTTGGSCRSRGGSNASDHPCYAVVCVLVSFALQIASLLSNDGSARWDGWVGSQERVWVYVWAQPMPSVVAAEGGCAGDTDDSKQAELVMPQQLCPGTGFLNCSVKLIFWLSALPPRRGRHQHQQRLHDKENWATLTSENFIYLVFRGSIYHIELTLLSEDICATSWNYLAMRNMPPINKCHCKCRIIREDK